MGQYRHHVFICTSGKTCPLSGSVAVHAAMKRLVHERGLKSTVRVNHAGCMNQCGHGPMMVIYPEDVWYCAVDEEGARRIVIEHIEGGEPVESLRYIAPPGDNKLVSDETDLSRE